ncbi:MAG: membrane-bound lytic murein transglycosylase MltF [Chromatiales bacterium]|jgi:membrane-bound lytic murein transglycosylase F
MSLIESSRTTVKQLKHLLLLSVLLLAACNRPPDLIDQIQQAGELRVVTRNGPTTFYEGPEGPEGFEYELIKRFAESLEVKPRFIVPDSFDAIIPMIANGKAHVAAAGLTITEQRRDKVRFSKSYQKITQQIVYLSGNKRPKKIKDLIGKKIGVIAGSSHEETLNGFKAEFPELRWQSIQNITLEQLLIKIRAGELDYTVADSNAFAIHRRFYPKLAVGFDLTKPEYLAWALQHSHDNSLYQASVIFFDQLKKSGVLNQLIERYYGHVKRLNFVDKRTFWKHVDSRLPELLTHFETAAEQTGYDWRLLAAIGYQESHWNAKAVSPTGVRGIMMLTKSTAKQLGIENRTSAEQSILGGARYLQLMEKKIPERIPYPDRVWLALAGYNVGFGHLEDARILTERAGDDPDRWVDVKKHLPLLSKPKVYKTLKYGYARGREPVNYVDNIRNYYDLLLWQASQEEPEEPYRFPKIPAVL